MKEENKHHKMAIMLADETDEDLDEMFDHWDEIRAKIKKVRQLRSQEGALQEQSRIKTNLLSGKK